jgi:hypothetical protein
MASPFTGLRYCSHAPGYRLALERLTMNASHRLLRLSAPVVLLLTLVFAAVHTQNAFAQNNCGLTSLTGPVGPTGCDVDFGASTSYANGRETSVAMNSAGLVVETHRGTSLSNDLLYRVGKLDATGGTIHWGIDRKTEANGYWPAVALGENGWVYLMYSTDPYRATSKQKYSVGTLNPNGDQYQEINWKAQKVSVAGDNGFHASLSVWGNLLVGIYETGGVGKNTCSYAIGTPNDPDHGDYTIHWYTGAGGKRTISGGGCAGPKIAVAPGGRYGQGQILLVYSRSFEGPNGIVYERGSIQNAGNNEKQMYWETGPTRVTTDTAGSPAIALLANGLVIEVHGSGDSNSFGQLRSVVGKMDLSIWSAVIDWSPSQSFDPSQTGTDPALTSNGAVAVQTHSNQVQGLAYPNLYYGVSSISDRNK